MAFQVANKRPLTGEEIKDITKKNDFADHIVSAMKTAGFEPQDWYEIEHIIGEKIHKETKQVWK